MMHTPVSLVVRNAMDVVVARAQVREVARRIGLGLSDQARISMATWSLAKALHFGESEALEGKIEIGCLAKGSRKGVRVVCLGSSSLPVPTTSSFGNEQWLVDEIDVKTLPPGRVEVTLTKWA